MRYALTLAYLYGYALFAAAVLLFCLSSCASPKLPPTFVAPSTVPIQRAHEQAKTHIEAARQIVSTLTISLPADKLKIDKLTEALTQAAADVAEAEGARASVDVQLQDETNQANAVATAYRGCQVDTDKLKASRHTWVKLAWLFGGTTVLAAAWIFKTPLMMLGA